MTYPPSSPDKNTVTASLVPAIPVPTYGPTGSFAVIAKVHINAPPRVVLDAVRDTGTWETWNTFCPGCRIDSSGSSSSSSETPTRNEVESAEEQGRSGGNGSGEGDRKEWLRKGTLATIDYVMSGTMGGSKAQQGIEVTVCDESWVSEDEGDEDGEGEGEGKGGGKRARKGCRIAWTSTGRATWQLRSERVMEFVDDGEGGCEYACWETFGGALGGTVKFVVGGKLKDRFGDYARDVKGFVERGSVVETRG